MYDQGCKQGSKCDYCHDIISREKFDKLRPRARSASAGPKRKRDRSQADDDDKDKKKKKDGARNRSKTPRTREKYCFSWYKKGICKKENCEFRHADKDKVDKEAAEYKKE